MLSVTCRELAITFNVPQVVIALQGQETDTLDIVAEYARCTRRGVRPGLSLRNPAIECIAIARTVRVLKTQRDPNMAVMRPILQRRGVASTLLVPLLCAINWSA